MLFFLPLAYANPPALEVVMKFGLTAWPGPFPDETDPDLLGPAFDLDLLLPFKQKFTIGGGLGMSGIGLSMPYSPGDASLEEHGQMNLYTIHGDFGGGSWVKEKLWWSWEGSAALGISEAVHPDCSGEDDRYVEVYYAQMQWLSKSEICGIPGRLTPVLTGMTGFHFFPGNISLFVLTVDAFITLALPHLELHHSNVHTGLLVGVGFGRREK
jgi:hypothetical protein